MNKLLAYRTSIIWDNILAIETVDNALVTPDYNKAFDFLTQSRQFTRVVWSLPDFYRNIISILPPEAVEQLQSKERNGYCATWTTDQYRNRIFYQPDKFFALNRRKIGSFGDCEVTFFELDQFFPNEAGEE